MRGLPPLVPADRADAHTSVRNAIDQAKTPEARALIALWNDYDPHVGFDLHTTNGSQHAYYLTYAPPLNPNTGGDISRLLKNEWFPAMTSTVKEKRGWDFFYYGNVSGGGRGRGRGAGALAYRERGPGGAGVVTDALAGARPETARRRSG